MVFPSLASAAPYIVTIDTTISTTTTTTTTTIYSPTVTPYVSMTQGHATPRATDVVIPKPTDAPIPHVTPRVMQSSSSSRYMYWVDSHGQWISSSAPSQTGTGSGFSTTTTATSCVTVTEGHTVARTMASGFQAALPAKQAPEADLVQPPPLHPVSL